MKVLSITKSNHDDEIACTDLPVLVDFWAPWCKPCMAMLRVVEQLADEYEGRIKVCKVNVDEEPQLAVKYNVMSVPTILLLVDKKVAQSFVGTMRKEALINKLSLQ